MEVERRFTNTYTATGTQREGLTQNGNRISGLGIVFNSWSHDLGGFIEIIEPDAVKEINWTGVVCLFNHDHNQILGKSPNTMTISVEPAGVRYDVVLPDSPVGSTVKEGVKRKDISGSSFGFVLAAGGDTWEKSESGLWKRRIKKFARIYDLSPVVFPAYPATSVDYKKLQQQSEDEAKRLKRYFQMKELELSKLK